MKPPKAGRKFCSKARGFFKIKRESPQKAASQSSPYKKQQKSGKSCPKAQNGKELGIPRTHNVKRESDEADIYFKKALELDADRKMHFFNLFPKLSENQAIRNILEKFTLQGK